MPTIPFVQAGEDAAPHVFILGAGASRAACPEGDKQGRPLPVMADLPEVVGLGPLLKAAGFSSVESKDFEALYDELATSGKDTEVVDEIEDRTRAYFEAIEIVDAATAYDYLVLSLRPKDLIASFNWDPLLVQTFRRHEGKISMPKLAFLHGNAGIGYCEEHKRTGWIDDRCHVCERPLSPSPLLFPVRDKDYNTSPSIRSEWARLEEHLARAYFVTIFGYSAPDTDAAAREIMHKVWSRNESKELAEIEIIDIRPPDQLEDKWRDFIVREHFMTHSDLSRSWIARHPRRSCDAFFNATMLCNPWKDNWIPRFSDPERLRSWLDPLWQEEMVAATSEHGFSGQPCGEM